MPTISDMVELPRDSNGETIQPGAKVMYAGKTWGVRTLMLYDEGEWLLDCQPEGGEPGMGRTVRPEGVVVRPRTVEDVLREFQDATFTLLEMHEAGEIDQEWYQGKLAYAVCEYAGKLRSMLDA